MSHSDENQIHELISLYFRGMTSSEQEKILYNFFIDNKKGDLPVDLQAYWDYFSSMAFLTLSAPTDLIKEKNGEKATKVTKIHFKLLKSGVRLSLAAAVIAGIIFLFPLLSNDSTESRDTNHDISLITTIPYSSLEQERELYFMACQDKDERENVIDESGLNQIEVVSPIMNSNEIDSVAKYSEIVDMDEAYKILKSVNERIYKALSPGIEVKNKIHEASKHISKTVKQIKIHRHEKSEF